MTQDQFEAEAIHNRKQYEYHMRVMDTLVAPFYADEVSYMLLNGYDVVCRVDEQGHASEVMAATICTGLIKTIAEQVMQQQEDVGITSVIVIHADYDKGASMMFK